MARVLYKGIMPTAVTLFLKALTEVQALLATHVEPGEPLDAETISTLRKILDDERLVATMQLVSRKPDGLKAIEGVREVFAEFAKELGAPFTDARPIASLRNPSVGRSYLLYCPGQGGWQAGRWIDTERPRWVTTLGTEQELKASHWMSAPPGPDLRES
jgi:hypothetical protein